MDTELAGKVLKRMPYGFYAVTSRDGDTLNAMVANWLTQASFEPQLISLALQKTSFTHGVIRRGRVFAINLFTKPNAEAIKPFTKGRSKNPDKMQQAEFSEAPVTGAPLLAGAAAYLECELVEIFDPGGDHDLVVGRVVGAGVQQEGEVQDTLTLLDLGWSYAG